MSNLLPKLKLHRCYLQGRKLKKKFRVGSVLDSRTNFLIMYACDSGNVSQYIGVIYRGIGGDSRLGKF